MKLHGALLLSSIALVAARPLRAQLLGAPFRVNTVTTGDQIEPAAAFDGHGNFVVVWTDSVAVGNTNVTGQRYDAAFSPIGGGFRVNTTGFFGGVLRSLSVGRVRRVGRVRGRLDRARDGREGSRRPTLRRGGGAESLRGGPAPGLSQNVDWMIPPSTWMLAPVT